MDISCSHVIPICLHPSFLEQQWPAFLGVSDEHGLHLILQARDVVIDGHPLKHSFGKQEHFVARWDILILVDHSPDKHWVASQELEDDEVVFQHKSGLDDIEGIVGFEESDPLVRIVQILNSNPFDFILIKLTDGPANGLEIWEELSISVESLTNCLGCSPRSAHWFRESINDILVLGGSEEPIFDCVP